MNDTMGLSRPVSSAARLVSRPGPQGPSDSPHLPSATLNCSSWRSPPRRPCTRRRDTCRPAGRPRRHTTRRARVRRRARPAARRSRRHPRPADRRSRRHPRLRGPGDHAHTSLNLPILAGSPQPFFSPAPLFAALRFPCAPLRSPSSPLRPSSQPFVSPAPPCASHTRPPGLPARTVGVLVVGGAGFVQHGQVQARVVDLDGIRDVEVQPPDLLAERSQPQPAAVQLRLSLRAHPGRRGSARPWTDRGRAAGGATACRPFTQQPRRGRPCPLPSPSPPVSLTSSTDWRAPAERSAVRCAGSNVMESTPALAPAPARLAARRAASAQPRVSVAPRKSVWVLFLSDLRGPSILKV
jgi:hypothetical protein